MPKFQSQSISMSLIDLQSAGYTAGGEWPIGAALPIDCLIMGMEVSVAESLAGPNLVSASATVEARTGPLVADLTQVGVYRNGGQQMVLVVALDGEQMALLTTGAITATIYYDRYESPNYEVQLL
jgi:hypothetical protein